MMEYNRIIFIFGTTCMKICMNTFLIVCEGMERSDRRKYWGMKNVEKCEIVCKIYERNIFDNVWNARVCK